MPRPLPAVFFEPLIHGVDVMLRKFERLIGAEPIVQEKTRLIQHRELVNLPAVTEQIASQYEDEADAKAVLFLVDVEPDALVIGDSWELHAVIEELIGTALENTPNGGCVAVSGAVSEGMVTLVFASYRLDAFPEESIHALPAMDCGRGNLGELLRAHGGRLELSNAPEHGWRFVLDLPIASNAL